MNQLNIIFELNVQLVKWVLGYLIITSDKQKKNLDYVVRFRFGVLPSFLNQKKKIRVITPIIVDKNLVNGIVKRASVKLYRISYCLLIPVILHA